MSDLSELPSSAQYSELSGRIEALEMGIPLGSLEVGTIDGGAPDDLDGGLA